MLTFEDKLLIKNLWECKGFFSRRLIKEFPNKNWKRGTLDDTAFVASDAPHFRRNIHISTRFCSRASGS